MTEFTHPTAPQMRKTLLFLAALAVPLASAGTALAGNGNTNGGNPHYQTGPSAAVTEIISKLQVDRSQVPGLGRPPQAGEQTLALAQTDATTASDCGACIEQCWYALARTGPSDWSGHAWLYQAVWWCGNGAWITYGAAGQSIDQAGWYRIDGQYGPWFSAGGLGQYALSVTGYMTWIWTSPFIGWSHSDTNWITTTVYAYGGASVS